MLDAAMTVHERVARQIFVAGGEYHWLRGICSLYGIGRFRLADLKCVYVLIDCIQNMYALKPDPCQPASMNFAVDFVLLWLFAKLLKKGQYKLTV
jgi:hypothetical protein